MGLFLCVCHPGEYGAHVPPWGLELADHLLNVIRNDRRQDQELAAMATTETQMLADLDELLADLQQRIATANAGGDPQTVIDDVEGRIATARAALADPTGSTPVADGGVPPVEAAGNPSTTTAVPTGVDPQAAGTVTDPEAAGVPVEPVEPPEVPDTTTDTSGGASAGTVGPTQ